MSLADYENDAGIPVTYGEHSIIIRTKYGGET